MGVEAGLGLESKAGTASGYRAHLDGLRVVAVYLVVAAAVGWALAIVLTFAPNALYTPYAELGSRPGGISALVDQQLAAGIMLVPGSITFLMVAGVALVRWLTTDEPQPASAEATAIKGEQ